MARVIIPTTARTRMSQAEFKRQRSKATLETMASPSVTTSTNDVRSIATKADQPSPSLVFARDNLRQLQTTVQWRVCAVAEDGLKENKHGIFFNYRLDAFEFWWTRWDSNPQPPDCERGKI